MAEAKPDWIKVKPAEVEKLVVALQKEGNGPEKIGLILRDKHGIPRAKLLGKKITKILEDNKIKLRPEKEVIKEEISTLKSHISKNKHDYPAQRSLTKRLWALHYAEK